MAESFTDVLSANLLLDRLQKFENALGSLQNDLNGLKGAVAKCQQDIGTLKDENKTKPVAKSGSK